MAPKRLATKDGLQRARVGGWMTLCLFPVLFIFLACNIWLKYAPHRITIVEEIVVFAVLPACAIGSLILGWYIVRDTTQRLRTGDFDPNGA